MVNTVRFFIKTFTYATVAQVLSLSVSVSLSLLLPKFISVDSYAYWQLFVLYSSYIGILHFGFNDGAYLKLGGRKFVDIDRKEWVPQYIFIFLIQLLGAIVLAYLGFHYVNSPIKQRIIYLLSFYIVVENCYKILGFTLMATDEMIFYSKTVIVDKVILLILLFGIISNIIPTSSTSIIQYFIAAHTIALLLLLFRLRDFFRQWYKLSFKNCTLKVVNNMIFGITLTISNLLSTFIIGSGRFFVEHYWNIETFAKISLAVSISMFMLVFISQIGLILFPILRNIEVDKQKRILDKSIFILGIVSLCLYIIFFPIYGFIDIWLPKYKESLSYLIFLFPISLYEIRSTMIFTTYLKNLNKIFFLCIINLITVSIAVILYWIASYFKSIEMILLVMLLTITFRSIVYQLYLFRYYSLKLNSYLFIEIIISALFIFFFRYLEVWYSLIIYTGIIIAVLFIYRKRLFEEYYFIKESLNRNYL
jgi:O-antigen/teichoic acid export membrane protein